MTRDLAKHKAYLHPEMISVLSVSGPSDYFFLGAVVVFEEPSGAGCIPGGDSPCGLEAGAPPSPVLVGPVQPCGCFWPFVSGVSERPVLDSGLSAGTVFWAFTELAKKIVSHVRQTPMDENRI